MKPLSPPKAYNELTNRILYPDDKQWLEHTLGALLTENDPRQVVVIGGRSKTGKTTLMTIIKKITLLSAEVPLDVVFKLGENFEYTGDTTLFVETDSLIPPLGFNVFIPTTGQTFSVSKYFALVHQIDTELDSIAEQCIQAYRNN